MASIRAGFVTLRTAQADAELPAELRFAPELELRLLGEEARGGVLTGGDASLALRRERTGVYCTAATGELSFQPDAGAADSELPFRLLLDKSSPWAEGVLTLDADGAPRLRLASASPAPAEGGVELELVLLVSSGGPPQAVAASVTASALSPLPLALPAAFLRTSSGRVSALEPIDEDVGVALPLPRRPLGHQPFLGGPPATDEPELRFFSSGGGCESDADLDDPGAELTWFSAGLRVGMGVGLGACLGVGLGLGILLSSYQRASRRLGQIKDGLLLK